MQRTDSSTILGVVHRVRFARKYVPSRCALVRTLICAPEPDNYDFTGTRAIATYDDTLPDDGTSSSIQEEGKTSSEKKDEKTTVSLRPVETFTPIRGMAPVRREVLEAVFRRALWYSLALAFIVTILGTIYLSSVTKGYTDATTVPIPMFFSHYVFSEGFYKFWLACTMCVASLTLLPAQYSNHSSIWVASSGIFCIVLPLWESRLEMAVIAQGIMDLCRRK